MLGSKKVKKDSIRRTTFRYRRAGKGRNSRKIAKGDRKRKTSSYKRKCPIELYEFANPDGSFKVKHDSTETSNLYNYLPNIKN